jgi:hypothetical protein
LSCSSIFCPMLISTDFFLSINILPYVDIHWFCLVHQYSALCWYPLILSCPSIFFPMLISTDFFLSINILPILIWTDFADIYWFCFVYPYSDPLWYPLVLSCPSIFCPVLVSSDFVCAVYILTYVDNHKSFS